MARNNKNTHLSFDERKIIETSIENGATKTDMANVLGKDKSTIGKEIKLHRTEKSRNTYPVDCSHFPRCKNKNTLICGTSCPNYQSFGCSRRDRSSGACNGCEKLRSCRYTHYIYNAFDANKEYKELLTDSRAGINTSVDELVAAGNIIKPLLRKGQSLYTICRNHPEIKYSDKTIYNYIEDGVFKAAGIDLTVMDLRMQVRRKPRKDKKKDVIFKERKDRKHLINRLYKDYLQYIADNPSARVVEMDTVYNDVTNGPFIQTFKFLKYGLLICIFHKEKTAASMLYGVNLLEDVLGSEIFRKEVAVLLTDRGSEFYLADQIEHSRDGTRRTKLFYCDPMCSQQKGSLENIHLELRYICPKGTNLYALGLTDQDKMNRVSSNINSTVKRELDDKSAFQLLQFYNAEFYEKLRDFGIVEVPGDEVVLKPHLLK